MKANTIIRRFGRFAACVAMLAAAACTGNFEDYNTKPFRPSDDDLNGDNVGVGILFPAMMEFVTHFQVNASQMHDVLVADELGGYTSAVKSTKDRTSLPTIRRTNSTTIFSSRHSPISTATTSRSRPRLAARGPFTSWPVSCAWRPCCA